MSMWNRDASRVGAGPRHRPSYLYAKAGVAKSSNVRRALGTVDDWEANRVGRQGRVQCAVRTVESCVAESSRQSLQLPPLLAAPREPRSASASRQCRAGRAADTTLRRRTSPAGHSDINIHPTCPRLREYSHQHSLRGESRQFKQKSYVHIFTNFQTIVHNLIVKNSLIELSGSGKKKKHS